MKRKLLIYLVIVFAITAVFSSSSAVFGNTSNTQSNKRMIVVFKNDVNNEYIKDAVIKKSGGIKIKNLNLVNGTVVSLTKKAEKLLASMKEVERIDSDIIVDISKKPIRPPRPTPDPTPEPSPEPTPIPSQNVPWGIDEIDAELVWEYTQASGIKVAVLDTGIDLSHPDLNVTGGFNAISTRRSANDDNGHGTHVAGIIAALNNSFGVVGVGPQIDLYAVKVLDGRGSGYLSDIIEGIGWCIDNDIQVINMSLGTSSKIQSFQTAIIQAQNAGIVIVAAAGNNYGGSVDYPAKYEEVIAVSATDSNGNIASFSSVGPEVFIAAPGANIYSTYKGSSYTTLSGTSMASPHIAGAVAIILSKYPNFSTVDVKERLRTTATDKGATGWDIFYGAGIVNVYQSIN